MLQAGISFRDSGLAGEVKRFTSSIAETKMGKESVWLFPRFSSSAENRKVKVATSVPASALRPLYQA